MKNYKELIQEASDLTKISKKPFEDSAEATDFMESVSGLISSPALKAWAKTTDSNYGTKTTAQLKKAMQAYDAFLEAMYSVDEM